jgi:hypothetical protein
VFLRGILTTAMLSLAAALGQLRFRTRTGDRARVAWRTVFEIGAMVAFLFALVNMPSPTLWRSWPRCRSSVTVAAALFLGEPLGWRRMSAVLVGFAGVLLIVQPGTEGFNMWSLSALLAVVIITGRDLVTRRFSPGLPSMAVAMVTAPAVGLFGGDAEPFETWVPMPGAREAG